MSDPRSELPILWQTLVESSAQVAPHEPHESHELDEMGAPAPAASMWDRRGFFKMMGLSAGAAALACSRAPAKRAIPFARAPEEIVPGTALHYASTCGGCAAGCGMLVKARDGRPIKLEGNEEHPVSQGALCAVGQASVLSVYDASRARAPRSARAPTTWEAQDEAVRKALQAEVAAGRAPWLVLPPVTGPTFEVAVARFRDAYPSTRISRREPLGDRQAVAQACQVAFGRRVVPELRFDEAKVIASFGADFLGTWLAPAPFTRRYGLGRDAASRRAMSRHYQVEAMMSLTGTNADVRLAVRPSDVPRALAATLARLLALAGRRDVTAPALGSPELPDQALDALAEALWRARPEALVVCGSDDPRVQLMAVLCNELLGAHGRTARLDLGEAVAEGEPFEAFLAALRAGEVGAAILVGQNPVFDHPAGEQIATWLRKVPLTVSTADRLDETARECQHLAPDHSPLEAWGDRELRPGLLGLRQPAVAPLFSTRAAAESLSLWAGRPQGSLEMLRARWETEVYPRARAAGSFQSFWDLSVQRGYAEVERPPAETPELAVAAVAGALDGFVIPAPAELELVLHPKVGLGDGALGNNAWLHELPDPVTKATWGNQLCVPVALARKLSIRDGQLVTVRAGATSVTAPALVQPGLHARAVALAVGYGRTAAGRMGDGVGVNAYALGGVDKALSSTLGPRAVTLAVEPGTKEVSLSQVHGSREGRPIVRIATLEAFLQDPAAGAEAEAHHGAGAVGRRSMWSGHRYAGHRWGLVVDLTACTGCGACVVACQAENNIPSVGADEVRRRREMHWMRIDRYYEGPLEQPTAVVHQPMMCQHCENAPCETVCPVLATVHSSEGLNQQVYNRCVGTRYCANNCPPKVRRFNWFEPPALDPLERMVLNPDVVVRSRGVMEKCSMCVQRIEEGKAAARLEGRAPRDGEIRTACQQGCPAGAISFGDLNDPASRVARLAKEGRAFKVLEELNVGPVVSYLTRIRNPGGPA